MGRKDLQKDFADLKRLKKKKKEKRKKKKSKDFVKSVHQYSHKFIILSKLCYFARIFEIFSKE